MEDAQLDLAERPLSRLAKLDYAWRWFATGASFVLFGVGGLVLRTAILPLLGGFPGGARERVLRARGAIGSALRLHLAFMCRSGVLRVSVQGAERLGRPGQLIIANHPSLIDVVVLLAQVRHSNCIVKHALWRNPFTRGPVTRAGYISNGDDPRMLMQASEALRAGETLIIFPEGTRTRPGQPPQFQRGAASIAVHGAQVITPVFISVVPTTLTKAEPWHRIPPRRVQLTLRVGDDINPERFTQDAPPPIASRRLNAFLQELYREAPATAVAAKKASPETVV